MNKQNVTSMLGLSAMILMAGSPLANAVTGMEMKACELAVLSQPRFTDLPMAAVSVYPGSDERHAHFTVRWQGLKADGNCKVNKRGEIKAVNVKKYHDGRGGRHNTSSSEWNHSGDLDGFYYDRHVDKWRDPHGRVCHTCLPESGFPDHSSQGYGDWRSKNHLEREMQREIRNMLSADDIKALNSLTK